MNSWEVLTEGSVCSEQICKGPTLPSVVTRWSRGHHVLVFLISDEERSPQVYFHVFLAMCSGQLLRIAVFWGFGSGIVGSEHGFQSLKPRFEPYFCHLLSM